MDTDCTMTAMPMAMAMTDHTRTRGMTLRTRLTLVATVTVAAVLVVGAALLVVALRSSLIGNIQDSATVRAADIATLAAQGSLPHPIPIQDNDETLVQVVATTGVVLAASNNIGDLADDLADDLTDDLTDDLPDDRSNGDDGADSADDDGGGPLPLAQVRPGEIRLFDAADFPDGADEVFRVVGHGVDTPTGPATVYVAFTLDAVNEVVDEITRLGLIGLPLLIVILAAFVWWVVGRTLAPVDAIRAETDEIGGQDLHRRVPVPDADDEIGRLARTVNRMLGRLEDSANRQRQFVGDAAHELRSPIASLRTQLETARDSSRPVAWHEVSDDLLDETLRMQHLTEQLLVLARIDAVGTAVARTSLDLDDLVADRVAAFTPSRDTIMVTTTLAPVRMSGDPVLLGQVVTNLLDNAFRHANAAVSVTVAATSGHAMITVADDGTGIAANRREHVFQRFARLDDARARDRGGAGLGLAIVADIVTAHGGTVAITSGPDGGATFTVALPVRSPSVIAQ